MQIEEGVRKLVGDVLGAQATGGVTSIVRFAEGDRHAVFRVSYTGGEGDSHDLVVRFSTSNAEAEREQVEREAAVLAALDGVGAPRLYDYRTESQWFDGPTMCLEFVTGEHREVASAEPSDVERLGVVVASIHDQPSADFADRFGGPHTLSEYVAWWVELIDSYGPRLRDPLPPSIAPRVERARAIVNVIVGLMVEEVMNREDRLVLLHGDIGPGNILWSDEPVLLDWEYARLGDPADEIAYIFGQHGLDSSRREAFWSGYKRVTTNPHVENVARRARWWEPVTLFGSALWWLERWSRRVDADDAGVDDPSAAKLPPYYLDQARWRLDGFDIAAESCGFQRA